MKNFKSARFSQKIIISFLIIFLHHNLFSQNVGCPITITEGCSSTVGISNFTFIGENGSNINSSSACSQNTLANSISSVNTGNTYNFSITPSSLSTPIYHVILVDWNDDNDFLDIDEFYDFGGSSGIFNGNLAIPSSISAATYNLLILSTFNGIGTPITQSNYCTNTFFVGEFEEYQLQVGPCVGLLGCTDNNFVEYNPNAFCDNGSCFTNNLNGNCNDCLQVLDLSTYSNIFGLYKADDVIYSNNQITDQYFGVDVIFNAGAKNDNSEFIELQAGFFADGTINFIAENIDCDLSDN